MTATILIVDDEQRSIETLRRILEREHYTVLTANNGAEAIKRIEETMPDLVLMDVTMPVMDGFEACRRLREREATQLLPIAMLTGLHDDDSRVKGLEIGADDFINKPFERTVLLARIRSLLRVRRLTEQLENTEHVIFALAATVEARDPYTEGHLRRLASYSEIVAHELGCSLREAKFIRYGGLLHDIGKIGIREAVLQKQGPLTPSEYEEMKKHPEIGAYIVAPMRFSITVGPMVMHHHERWDGGGYPQGLAGEAIPLGARIIAVVDSFDAMTTDRPYRKGMPHEAAMNILLNGRNTQWQAEIVDTFVKIIAEGRLPHVEDTPRETPIWNS
ncbi:MAG: response regulator [Herpetosiphon sp.]|nr:response regulator [Herpetosiphon sp.]